MSEWWTYSLFDFLLFAPRTYYRLFELYNAAVWPAQPAVLAAGAAISALIWRGGRWASAVALILLAAAWAWVAWAFHLERYATINWAAEYFAWGFALEAALLFLAPLAVRVRFAPLTAMNARIGLAVFAFALVLQPLIGPALGRSWRQAELFGLAPDPTAIATLGVVIALAGRTRWALLLLPLVWCLVSGATLWAMAAPDALLLPLAALLALAPAIRNTRRRRASP
jgi:hypothetical protein